MSMLKTETDIHTDEVIHRARAPTVALAKNCVNHRRKSGPQPIRSIDDIGYRMKKRKKE